MFWIILQTGSIPLGSIVFICIPQSNKTINTETQIAMDTSTYIAKTWIPKGQSPMRDMEVDGSTSFQIPTSEFVISPLNAPASLYVLSIREGVENPKPIVQLNANEYTQISGLVPNITLYVGTSEKFYIRF